MTGRTAEAVRVAEAGYADHVALGDELAIAHPAMHIVNQVFALTEAGGLAEAEQLARAGTEIVASQRVPVAQIFFAVNLGRVATLQGRVATARRCYAEAAGLAQASHFAGRSASHSRAWLWRTPCSPTPTLPSRRWPNAPAGRRSASVDPNSSSPTRGPPWHRDGPPRRRGGCGTPPRRLLPPGTGPPSRGCCTT